MKLKHLTSGTPTISSAEELQRAFDHYNRQLFGGILPPCLMTLQRTPNTFGYFSSQRFLHVESGVATDEISINPAYLANFPVIEAMQTVVHEMCHMWQYHFGKPSKRSYHNKEWADKMEAIGLMPSSTGLPGGARTGEKIADYPIAGGRFLDATQQLFSAGPLLTWCDRFSVPGPSSSMANALQTVQASSVGLSPEVLVDTAQSSIGATATDPTTGLPTWLTQVPASTGSTLAQSLAGPAIGHSGQRTKYSCGCGSNVWGRRGLNLKCEDCQQSFKEQ